MAKKQSKTPTQVTTKPSCKPRNGSGHTAGKEQQRTVQAEASVDADEPLFVPESPSKTIRKKGAKAKQSTNLPLTSEKRDATLSEPIWKSMFVPRASPPIGQPGTCDEVVVDPKSSDMGWVTHNSDASHEISSETEFGLAVRTPSLNRNNVQQMLSGEHGGSMASEENDVNGCFDTDQAISQHPKLTTESLTSPATTGLAADSPRSDGNPTPPTSDAAMGTEHGIEPSSKGPDSRENDDANSIYATFHREEEVETPVSETALKPGPTISQEQPARPEEDRVTARIASAIEAPTRLSAGSAKDCSQDPSSQSPPVKGDLADLLTQTGHLEGGFEQEETQMMWWNTIETEIAATSSETPQESRSLSIAAATDTRPGMPDDQIPEDHTHAASTHSPTAQEPALRTADCAEDAALYWSDGEVALRLLPSARSTDLQRTTQEQKDEKSTLFVTDDEDSNREDQNRQLGEKGRVLRPRERRNQNGEWLDDDTTGDYDPSCPFSPEKAAKKFPERKKKRPRKSADEDDEPQEPQQRLPPTTQLARFSGMQALASLSFDSEKWRGKLRELTLDTRPLDDAERQTRGEDNWPEESSDTEPNFTEVDANQIMQARLRERANLKTLVDSELSELPGLGNPLSRGCIGCYELGQQCSLIGGGRYPCDACEDDDNALCKLILEPSYKESCQHCPRSKCSFKNDPTREGACKSCLENGRDCVMGPKSGFTRVNPCLGEDVELFKEKRRAIGKVGTSGIAGQCDKWDSLSEQRLRKSLCEVSKRGCSDRIPQEAVQNATSCDRRTSEQSNSDLIGQSPRAGDDAPSPPKRRKTEPKRPKRHRKTAKAKTKATFVPMNRNPQLPQVPGCAVYRKPFRQHQNAGKDINLWVPGPAAVMMETLYLPDEEEDLEMEYNFYQELRHGMEAPGRMSALSAVPVYQMCGAQPVPPVPFGATEIIHTRLEHPIAINHETSFDCDWCQHPSMAVLGIDEQVLTVREAREGYFEVTENDDILDVEARLRMCVRCTSARLDIANCGHHMKRISGPVGCSFDDVVSSLLDDSLPRVQICSICPRGAVFRCVAYDDLQFDQSKEGSCAVRGCGLLLCQSCNKGIEAHGDDFSTFVMDKELGTHAIEEVRADTLMFGHVVRRLNA